MHFQEVLIKLGVRLIKKETYLRELIFYYGQTFGQLI